jgi:flavin reductase (DIM6/NTAB) family NADH-FMN oxidoreductase RutF
MEKQMIGKSHIGPNRAIIVGALVNGKANYLTLGHCGEMAMNPAIVYISMNKAHFTNAGIKENGYFSLNIPSKSVVQKMDYVGLVSGRDVDKSGVFKAFFGSVDKAPMIEECPANILCKVIKTVDLPNNDVFIGEIVETYVSPDCLTEGKPDIKKINPVLLSGGKYYQLGIECGNAFSDGKVLIKK